MRPRSSLERILESLNSSPFTTVNATALTPMPMASVSTAIRVNTGRRQSCLMECLRSWMNRDI